jgi:2-polyprenyl-6-methoxyphenol hydroxylase-like FAD-dependent oxidoreductase
VAGSRSVTTTACIVGCGPAGAMLGLLLARAGVEVVLEKHADFLRDFRGDTVHPSTIEVLAELGLAERFLALPHHKVAAVGFVRDGRKLDVADFRRLGLRHPYIAFVPQWDFLDLVTREAARYPNLRLLMQAEGYDFLREGGRVVGVRYRGPDGDHEVRAHLVVATDGRHSAIRLVQRLMGRLIGVGVLPEHVRVPARATPRSEPDDTSVISRL